MDIQYAILGFLSWQPFSGYDLKKIISESDLFYWSGNNNQIYKSLIELHQTGQVTQQILYQENLPARKVYSITEKGMDALRVRLLSHPELPEFRNNFLIQLAWSDPLSKEEMDELLGKYEEEIDVQLRMRQVQALTQNTPQRSPREVYLYQRISENMLASYQHELDWVRQVREALAKEDYS
jgi:PadR family transcriptional regulator, regulatory protein AphA